MNLLEQLPSQHPHELTLFFYPSPGLDWSSPWGLARSTANNKLKRKPRSIGHVSVRIKSQHSERPIDILTGMTQKRYDEGMKEVIFLGYGLGILLHDFDGELETPEKLAPELIERSTHGRLSYLRCEINRSIAERLYRFLNEYKQMGADQHYGMPHRPLHGEGGGCSAFGASFLETAGLMSDEYRKNWTRYFNMPKNLIGGPNTGKYISPLHMYRGKRWANEDEDHVKGFFWDPDLMHSWCMDTWKSDADHSKLYTKEKWNEAFGLVLKAHDQPVPDKPLFTLK